MYYTGEKTKPQMPHIKEDTKSATINLMSMKWKTDEMEQVPQ